MVDVRIRKMANKLSARQGGSATLTFAASAFVVVLFIIIATIPIHAPKVVPVEIEADSQPLDRVVDAANERSHIGLAQEALAKTDVEEEVTGLVSVPKEVSGEGSSPSNEKAGDVGGEAPVEGEREEKDGDKETAKVLHHHHHGGFFWWWMLMRPFGFHAPLASTQAMAGVGPGGAGASLAGASSTTTGAGQPVGGGNAQTPGRTTTIGQGGGTGASSRGSHLSGGGLRQRTGMLNSYTGMPRRAGFTGGMRGGMRMGGMGGMRMGGFRG